jgi:hypothetical protein
MIRRYYSSRNRPKNLTLSELYWKLQNLYLFFRDKDYFKGKAEITKIHLPDSLKHKAALALTFQPFPITKWDTDNITEDHIFDTIEFLYDHVSTPIGWGYKTTETGFNYEDYDGYDDEAGKKEFQDSVNSFLCDYKTGYELTADGSILALGTEGLQYILDTEIPPYDEVNVDSKVREAITKWRNRQLSIAGKKEAIRELADVFEWLKKERGLENVLTYKDASAIFEIANNFGIRHHTSKQKTNYDQEIWYSWIFHFYLATYYAAIRLLKKHQNGTKSNKRGK